MTISPKAKGKERVNQILSLFKIQRELDDFIIKTKGLQGLNLLPNKILALRVELGELANEWKGFKYWSNKPINTEKALVEFVDCFHFVNSIGIYLGAEEVIKDMDKGILPVPRHLDTTNQFNYVFDLVKTNLSLLNWFELLKEFLGLGALLGFKWGQIQEAYEAKWQINIQRQQEGY